MMNDIDDPTIKVLFRVVGERFRGNVPGCVLAYPNATLFAPTIMEALVKAYAITTGTIFGLIVAAHLWRAVAEGAALARNPVFIFLTVAPAALALWAWRLFRTLPRL
jgi:hypothetical protein